MKIFSDLINNFIDSLLSSTNKKESYEYSIGQNIDPYTIPKLDIIGVKKVETNLIDLDGTKKEQTLVVFELSDGKFLHLVSDHFFKWNHFMIREELRKAYKEKFPEDFIKMEQSAWTIK